MDEYHPVIEEFRRYSGQMEQAFTKNRFDTFRQLSMDRFKLLRQAPGTPGSPNAYSALSGGCLALDSPDRDENL